MSTWAGAGVFALLFSMAALLIQAVVVGYRNRRKKN